ncbi:terpene synthase family protein [Streptomyces sp. 1222.5]|uniref:terpene synthase family protein n=1 Tax=Streptomyces sp. 1222.5 TaxID=1881026 RepID=UPI003D70F4C6
MLDESTVPVRPTSTELGPSGLGYSAVQLPMQLRAARQKTAATSLSVVDLDAASSPDVKLTTLPLEYPAHWLSPVRLSPFAHTIEHGTMAWMESLGLFSSSAAADEVRAMEPRHYGGYPHSLAAYEHALAFCQYVTMWLLWDDKVVEKATSIFQVEPALAALAGTPVDPEHRNDPYVRAFRHLGDEYERLGASRAWRTGFADAMRHWARQAILEEEVRRRTAGADRPFQETLALRVETNGLLPTSMTLERAVGIELPNALRADPCYLSLLNHAGQIVCIVNDLVAVGKDLHHGQQASNTVLCYRRNTGRPLREAYEALIDVHDRSIKTYDRLAAMLLAKAEKDVRERFAAFLGQLRYMCSGFAFWHTGAARYRRFLAVEAGQAFRVEIVAPSSAAA